MTEQLIEETIELGEVDEADLAKLYAGGDGEGGEEEGGEPEYHTIMEVWQRLLTDGIASEADDKPGLVWTGRMLASYQGLEWYDGYAIRDAYFTKLQQALDVVNLEISYEPSALTVISAADDAAANAERARAVQGSGALSAQQVNQYLTQEQTAKARVESAKAQLDAQLLRLKNTRLLTPDSGVISARMAAVGAVVGAGTEMFKLIRQGRLEWRGEVTSTELGRITPGVGVLLTAPGGAHANGKVRTVAPTVDPATRNGLVYVDLQGVSPNGTAGFKPGMYARGEFELGQSSAVTVPQSAVVVRDGFSFVARVGADNRVAQVKVQTGRIVGDQVEILSGVKPEDKLVASGGSFLSDGDLVRIADEKSAPAPVKPASVASK
mgnify:CR=1 FL=1